MPMLRRPSLSVLRSRSQPERQHPNTTLVRPSIYSTSCLPRDCRYPTGLNFTKKPTVEEEVVSEPLFQDCYLPHDDELLPIETSVRPNWAVDLKDLTWDEESFEDLKAQLLGFQNVIATTVSILSVGKPKVVDVSPPSSIKSCRQRPHTYHSRSTSCIIERPYYLHSRRTSYTDSECSSYSTPSSVSDISEGSYINFSRPTGIAVSYTQLPDHALTTSSYDHHIRSLSGSVFTSKLRKLRDMELVQTPNMVAPGATDCASPLNLTPCSETEVDSMAEVAAILKQNEVTSPVWFKRWS